MATVFILVLKLDVAGEKVILHSTDEYGDLVRGWSGDGCGDCVADRHRAREGGESSRRSDSETLSASPRIRDATIRWREKSRCTSGVGGYIRRCYITVNRKGETCIRKTHYPLSS